MIRSAIKVLGGLAVLLGVLIALGLTLSWAPDRSVEVLKPKWANAASKFVTVQGMQVHVRDEGPLPSSTSFSDSQASQPIVLLHGTSASLHTWDDWAESLRKNRRVIRFDLPGFGLTGPNPNNDYSPDAYAAFVLAVLDALKVSQPVVLAGNSLGGQIAWNTAYLAPQRISKLILIDSAGYPFTPNSVPIGFQIARSPLLAPLMKNTLPRFLVASSIRNVYGDATKVTESLIDRYYDLTLREGNRKALGIRLQGKLAPNSERIATLKQPTLILWGKRDKLIPLENGQRFAKDIAGSQLTVFDNLGHVPHEEDPQSTLARVQQFLLNAQ